jgi:hypothetical protein
MANYVNNKDFYQLLKDYKQTHSKITYEKIGLCFLLIAKNFINKPKYINRTDDRKDEMISDAIYYMCRYIHKYNIEKTNPFAYFTKIAKNAFLQNIESYNKRGNMFSSLEYIENFDNNN